MAFVLPVCTVGSAAAPVVAAPLRSSFVGERPAASRPKRADRTVDAPVVFCAAESDTKPAVQRRSLLAGLVAAVAASALPSSSQAVEGWSSWLQEAGDVAVEDALRYDLLTAIQKNGNAPSVLRLAFHDAGVGGPDGSIRFGDELVRPENGGLEAAFESLKPIKPLYATFSWADVIAVAGAAAVEATGGPIIHVGLGRRDATRAGPLNRLPSFEADAADLRQTFSVYGLKDKDIVALSGAHTLGKFTMPDGTRFAWTPEPDVFDNTYYKVLTGEIEGMKLPSDEALMADPIFKDLVEQYASDQAAFFSAFANSYKRMTAFKK